jgi:hypothetical protein
MKFNRLLKGTLFSFVLIGTLPQGFAQKSSEDIAVGGTQGTEYKLIFEKLRTARAQLYQASATTQEFLFTLGAEVKDESLRFDARQFITLSSRLSELVGRLSALIDYLAPYSNQGVVPPHDASLIFSKVLGKAEVISAIVSLNNDSVDQRPEFYNASLLERLKNLKFGEEPEFKTLLKQANKSLADLKDHIYFK